MCTQQVATRRVFLLSARDPAERTADGGTGADIRTSSAPRCGSGDALEQVVLLHGGEGEHAVPLALEEDRNAVLLDAHDGAVAPLPVPDGGVDRERRVALRHWGRLLLGVRRAGRARVAVAARLVELLSEVGEQVLPPARQRLRVLAHHGDARL